MEKTVKKKTREVKKPEVRKKEIVKAARQFFLARSYEKTSMQELVESLGIAKGTAYHYFKSKEDLFEAVIMDLVEEDHARKRQLIKKMKGNALDKIRQVLELEPIAARNEAIVNTLHHPNNAGMHARLLAATLMKEAAVYSELIDQGCKEGVFHTDTPLECAEFLLAAIQFLTDEGIYPWSSEDILRRVKTFPSLIETLLKAPKGSFKFMLKRLSP